MYPNRNSGLRSIKTSHYNPYPLTPSHDVPELPNLENFTWVMQDKRPPKPVIGFKLEILNGHSIEPPYPENDSFAMEVSPDPVPIRPKSGSSGDNSSAFNTDDSSSDIDDIEDSKKTFSPTVLRVQSIDEPEGPDMRNHEIIEVKSFKPQPTSLRGEAMQFTRKGFPYPMDAYAKTSNLPCNHSGGES